MATDILNQKAAGSASTRGVEWVSGLQTCLDKLPAPSALAPEPTWPNAMSASQFATAMRGSP